MIKRTNSLLFKIGMIFIVFTIGVLLMSGISTYYNQTEADRKDYQEEIKKIAVHLGKLMQSSSVDFENYQTFFVEHHEDIRVPYNYAGDYRPEKEKFESLFAGKYPGKTLNKDIDFSELAYDVQLAFATYYYEYWLNVFEKTRDTFHISYAYYMTPMGGNDMLYIVDGARMSTEIKGKKYLIYKLNSEHLMKNLFWKKSK